MNPKKKISSRLRRMSRVVRVPLLRRDREVESRAIVLGQGDPIRQPLRQVGVRDEPPAKADQICAAGL